MSSNRIYNFNPGPAALPLAVLEKAREELLDYRGTGMSVMELSHRSNEFEEIIFTAGKLLLKLADLDPEQYQALFLQGGASLQFSMLPLNFLPSGTVADYVLTGSFAEKAWKEASRLGKTSVAASTKEDNYCRIPSPEEIKLKETDSAYLHITTNNTIYGTQWKYIPECGGIPLVADMSSDIFSRKLKMDRFDLVYAGAQKNLGPAGVTAVIIKKDLLERVPATLPAIFSYREHAAANSLYNTPPSFSVYMVKLVLEWLQEKGGLEAVEKENEKKAALLYSTIDASEGFYSGHARETDRSMMNVTFRLPAETEETAFLQEAAKNGLMGLKGHRSVGGIRASIYNAMPLEGCAALADFMKDFMKISKH